MAVNLVINNFIDFSESNPLRKSKRWRTDMVQFESGKEQRNQIMEQPIRSWELNWEILDKTQRDNLIAIFQRCRGKFDTFKYLDSDEFQVTNEVITVLAAAPTMQLVNTSYGATSESWLETRTLIVPASIITFEHSIDGIMDETTHWTLDDETGIVTFVGSVSAGDITLSYQYYFKVRFSDDTQLDEMPETELYSHPRVNIVEVL